MLLQLAAVHVLKREVKIFVCFTGFIKFADPVARVRLADIILHFKQLFDLWIIGTIFRYSLDSN